MAERIKKVFVLIWYLAAPLLFYMVISDMTLAAWQIVRKSAAEQEILAANGLGAAAASGCLYRWYAGERGQCLPQKRGACRVSPGAAAWIVLLGISACVSVNHLLILLHIPDAAYETARQRLFRPPLPVQIVCTGLVIPLAEELVFRGLGYGRIRRMLPVRTAVLTSSVFFGLFHGNLLQGVYALVLGAFLAYLYEWYQSLTAVWLFHAAANLTSVLVQAWLPEAWFRDLWPVTAAVAAAGALLSAAAVRKIREERNEHEIIVHSDTML